VHARERRGGLPHPDANGIIQYYGGKDQPEFKSASENCRDLHLLPEKGGLGTEEGAPGGGG
jgi:hypothetical protein